MRERATDEDAGAAPCEGAPGGMAGTARKRGGAGRALRGAPRRRLLTGAALGVPRRVFEGGRLRVDLDAYEVWVDGREVPVLRREFELLSLFVQRPGRVLDRAEIIRSVWGDDADIEPRTIDVHVRRLRSVVERDPSRPELIVTVRGAGYRFDPDALEAGARGLQDPGSGGDAS